MVRRESAYICYVVCLSFLSKEWQIILIQKGTFVRFVELLMDLLALTFLRGRKMN